MFLIWLATTLAACMVTAILCRWYWKTVHRNDGQLAAINRQLTSEIAERQELEKALRISQQNYRSIVEDQSEMILRFTVDGTVTFANKAYCDRYQLTPEQCVGTNCFANIHPDSRPLAMTLVEQVEPTKPTATIVLRVARPDGSQDWAEWTGRALYDVDGSLVGYQAIGRIVTDLVETQRRLQESELRYRSIVEGQSEMIVRVTREGLITFANAAFMRANNLSTDQQPPASIADLLEPDEMNRAMQVISSMTSDRPTEDIRLQVVRDGQVYWEDWHGQALFDQQDQFLCIQAVGRDVTKLVRAEEELYKKEELLRHASRLSILGEMVAAITHELRQPLYSISNFAFACQHQLNTRPTMEGDRLKRWNLDIIDQVQRANEIIHRLRGFSRRSDAAASWLNIQSVIGDSVALLQFELNHAMVRIVQQAESETPLVWMDRLQIEQVLVNLIRNSCDALSGSHTPAPTITISVSRGEQSILVSVADNGPGLPQAELERIFQPFRTNKPDGLGLGLAICRSIIQEHEGEIWAENCSPGLKVSFRLPLSPSSSSAP